MNKKLLIAFCGIVLLVLPQPTGLASKHSSMNTEKNHKAAVLVALAQIDAGVLKFEPPLVRTYLQLLVAARYLELGERSEAHYRCDQILVTIKKINDSDLQQLIDIGLCDSRESAREMMQGFIYNSLAALYLQLDDYHRVIKVVNMLPEYLRDQTYDDFVDVSVSEKEYQKGLRMAEKIKAPDMKSAAFISIASAYSEIGEIKKASSLLSKTFKLADLITDIEEKEKLFGEIIEFGSL